MDLDQNRLAHALALSGTRAATPMLVRRGGISAAKSIANALVAQSGVEAALLAEQGVTGPLAIVEHEHGLRSVFPNGDPLTVLTAPLTERSYIMDSNVKAYPCVATGQAAVATAIKLHKMLNGMVNDVIRIEVAMADYPSVRRQQQDAGRTHPTSRESADHSFQFLVASALTDGTFGAAQFDNERWHDPATVALMERIVMSTDASLNERAPGTYPCAIRAIDKGGRTHAAEILFPPGYSHGGIKENEVVDKFHAITASVLDQGRRDRIVAAALAFDRAATAETLTAAIGA